MAWLGHNFTKSYVGFKGMGYTLQGINISHLGKRKIIFKMPFLWDMLVPWRVVMCSKEVSSQVFCFF